MDQVIDGVIKLMQLIFFFFVMWTIFKVSIEFVTVLLMFYVVVFFFFFFESFSLPARHVGS